MEKYVILSGAGKDGKVSVRRVSDGKVSRCKLTWLEQINETEWAAKSNTNDIRMYCLEWTTEETK